MGEGVFSESKPGHTFFLKIRVQSKAEIKERIATAGTICREAVCGEDFTDVMIRTIFGFHPRLNLNRPSPLWAADQVRTLFAKLEHMRWGNRLITIVSGPQGLRVEKE